MTEPEKIMVLTLSKCRFYGAALFFYTLESLDLCRYPGHYKDGGTFLKVNTEYKMTQNTP